MNKFSMMELLVVMGILLLLMSLLLPNVAPMMNRAEFNRIVSIIEGQLEVGYAQSLDKSKEIRVNFEFDPRGKDLNWSNIQKICAPSGPKTEYEARMAKEFDLNGDGISTGDSNRLFFWMKGYLCHQDTLGKNTIEETRTDFPGLEVLGPYWIRRQICRAKDTSDNFRPTKIRFTPVQITPPKGYYMRLVTNEGILPIFGFNSVTSKNEWHLKPRETLTTPDINGESTLIDDANVKLDYTLCDTYNGPLIDQTYGKSVALYKSKNGERYTTNYGLRFVNLEMNNPAGRLTIDTSWFDIMVGDESDPKSLDFGANDDEDDSLDEGMSLYVQSYDPNGTLPTLKLSKDTTETNISTYNGYFDKIEDNHYKIGREFFIGGVEKKGVMLRRVWGVEPGKTDLTLIWKFDDIIEFNPTSYVGTSIRISTPYFFSVVFDQNNGGGMSFSNSFGSQFFDKFYFQVSDDDNKIDTLIELSEGKAREGTLKDFVGTDSRKKMDEIDYYRGIKK